MHTLFKWSALLKKLALAHKAWSVLIIAVVLVGGWRAYAALTSGSGQTYYVLGTASSTTIVSVISASGQIAASNSVDIKPQVSGTITWIGVKQGDKMRSGQALMTIDDTTALQTLQNSKNQLATDELNYQKAQAQAPISYQSDLNTLASAQENLANDYTNVYNDLSSTYLDLPAIVSGAQSTLYGYNFDPKHSVWNVDYLYNLFITLNPQLIGNVTTFRDSSESDYTTASTEYTAAVSAYGATSRSSSNAEVDALLSQTITMNTDLAQVLQTELNFLGAVSDLSQSNGITLPSQFSTVQSAARTYLSTANTDLSKLLADQKTLNTDKQDITSAQQTITLDQVGNPNGNNPISLQVTANSLAQEKQNIANEETNLADYTIRAPFAGTISAVNVLTGDSAGSAAVASIISGAQVADMSLDEVDAAKVKVGDKATLTFDALPSLTLTGTVATVDSVGTVSQGVVSYDITIALDTQNNQVKPGMTVTADIETDVAQNALAVPSSAVKTQGGQSYVQVFEPAIASSTVAAGGAQGIVTMQTPVDIPVVTGISDTTNTQILSGLSAGQQIIVSTRAGSGTSAAATAATRTAASAGATGGGFRGGFGGGGIRIGG